MINLLRKEEKEINAFFNRISRVEKRRFLLFFPDLPDDHPRITGVNEQYEPGEGITATCTAWHSNPPANLSWFINGEPVSYISANTMHVF